jgi:glutamyl-tRNA reductase
MTEAGRSITAVVAHARRIPAPHRTALAAALRDALPQGSLVLETCHRVEGYVVGSPPTLELPDGADRLAGDAAVRHAIDVAVGTDSVVLLEDQILHQLRESVAAARSTHGLDPTLDRLFAIALRAGRRARSWRAGAGRSLADVALEAIQRREGAVAGRAVLVVGAGRMGAAAARALGAAGADLTVTSKTPDSAQAVAAPLGARTGDFDPGPGVGRYRAVIVALAGPWAIATRTMGVLQATDTLLVDLSVPAAVPEVVARSLGDRLVTADDLARFGTPTLLDDPRANRRLARLIEASMAEFLEWQDLRAARSAADALQRRADRELETELSVLWQRVPELEPDARREIEDMTRRLTGRLLREPLERLGRDRDGRSEQAVRDLFSL